ncbi:hypothetical protein J2T12_001251 [Paenibacillus anaericanus]|uniref:galactose-binding domain-containing protein n=1 Tax=Paenibacillus anaericanus TaxID=170367 RepID=UPI002781CFC2|nr:discoidin domain-containing protein [Paenibacillus anaericanus]MDQ0087845.1 hypothetical protein [Paenibacillus anaericanus]
MSFVSNHHFSLKRFTIVFFVCLLLLGSSFHKGVSYADAPVNVAGGKYVTASSEIMGNSAFVTDGDKSGNNYIGVTENLQWIQIDLRQNYSINKVNLWHYFADSRTYHDIIVRVSNDSNFSSGVTTVFNNDTNNSAGLGAGTNAEYSESSLGKSIEFSAVNARYVRLYTNGSSANIYNHYVEVEVWGVSSGGGGGGLPIVTNAMFDDFNYTGPYDSNLGLNNWTLRSYSGGPGPGGATWSPDNISFLNDPNQGSNKIMRLKASTDGTGVGTSEAEIYTSSMKYKEGTYAARVRFTDSPVSGVDGDGIVETFFTISSLRYDNDPLYSELDFELLANGGWGVTQPAMWNTSWYTYSNNPWSKDNVYNAHQGDYTGWHTLIMVVANGEIKYYLDGNLISTHGGQYYPRTNMSINFNLWFMAEALLGSTGNRTYEMDVDWVYHAKNMALTPAEVNSILQNYRNSSITHADNI